MCEGEVHHAERGNHEAKAEEWSSCLLFFARETKSSEKKGRGTCTMTPDTCWNIMTRRDMPPKNAPRRSSNVAEGE